MYFPSTHGDVEHGTVKHVTDGRYRDEREEDEHREQRIEKEHRDNGIAAQRLFLAHIIEAKQGSRKESER